MKFTCPSHALHLTIIITSLFSLVHGASSSSLQRRVNVDPELVGSPVSMAGGNAYGRATTANDGSLLGSATFTGNGNNTITALSSTNGGASWTVRGSITTGVTEEHDIDNAFLLQLPSGRMLASFRNHDRNGTTDYTYYRITVCSSDDEGQSWTYLSQAAEQAAMPSPYNNGLWEPFLRVTTSGDVQIYYSRQNNATSQDLIMSSSSDQGATWSTPVVVIGADQSNTLDGMIGIAPLGVSSTNSSTSTSSQLLAIFESGVNGIFTVEMSQSMDDGATWGPRGTAYKPSNGLSAQAPQVANVGGTLVAIFMTNEDTGAPGTTNETIKLLTSDDGGATWGSKVSVAAPPAFWPGLCTLAEDTVMTIFGKDGVETQNVTLSSVSGNNTGSGNSTGSGSTTGSGNSSSSGVHSRNMVTLGALVCLPFSVVLNVLLL